MSQTVSLSGSEAPFVLERKQRLSRSLLWKLQRNYFDWHGIRAWNEGAVPHLITSSPWIATAYAHVVFAWLRDCCAPPNERPLDFSQPVYLIELGCGNGRFGYLFVRKLSSLLSRSALRQFPIKYVYTDFTEYNLDILRSHPSLQPLVEGGLVDFACLDVEKDQEIRLSESGETLSKDTIKNPVAVLSNYVFDGVRQDLFRTSCGELQEALVSLSSVQEEQNLDDPELLSRVQITCEYQPVTADFYDDPGWNRILKKYCDRVPDTVLLFPCGALTCLNNLRRLAGDRLLLLSGDKGDVHEQSLVGRQQLHLAVHGSVSLMVNYHAIGQYVQDQGGCFLSTSHVHSSLKITATLFGRMGEDHCETRLAFDEFIEKRGPDDFYALKQAAVRDWDGLSLQQIIACLRLSEWDQNIFQSSSAALIEKAKEATKAERLDLEALARKVWENYFPLRETHDIAFQLGLLWMVMLRFSAAIEMFERSLQVHGPNAATHLNIAISHCNLGQWAEADAQVAQALALDPESGDARLLKRDIDAARSGRAEIVGQ